MMLWCVVLEVVYDVFVCNGFCGLCGAGFWCVFLIFCMCFVVVFAFCLLWSLLFVFSRFLCFVLVFYLLFVWSNVLFWCLVYFLLVLVLWD